MIPWNRVGSVGLVVITVGLLTGAWLTCEAAVGSSDSTGQGVGVDNSKQLSKGYSETSPQESSHDRTGAGGASVLSETVTADGPGRLFLAGNEIAGPWTLRRFRVGYAVNGLATPPLTAATEDPRLRSRLEFLARVGTRCGSLIGEGLSPDELERDLRAYCENYGDSVLVTRSWGVLTVGFPGGPEVDYFLVPARIPMMATPAGGSTGRRSRLQQVADYLRHGDIVFVINDASEVVIPKARAGEAVQAISSIRGRLELDPMTPSVLPRIVQQQLLEPAKLIPAGE